MSQAQRRERARSARRPPPLSLPLSLAGDDDVRLELDNVDDGEEEGVDGLALGGELLSLGAREVAEIAESRSSQTGGRAPS